MRHVTDGELHAFLDSALDLLPQDRGEEVRDHISSCPVCRERLQDEKLIRSQAEEILGDPELGEIALPTFEELRERAEAPGSDPLLPAKEPVEGIRYRGPVKGLPLAWAATIVLALGVGWMGGQVWKTLPDGGRPGGPVSTSAPREQPAAQSADLDAESSRADEVQLSRVDLRDVSTPSAAEERVGDPPPSAPQSERTRGAQRQSAPEEPEAAFRPSDSFAVVSRSAVGEVVMDETGRITDPAALTDAARAIDSLVVAPALDYAPMVPAGRTGGVVMEPDSLETSLALRGLKVVSIEWEERVPGEKALLIRQLLSPGDTLELRYLGMLLGSEPDPRGLREGWTLLEEAHGGRVYANVLEASLPPGWHQVVMERGRGLLVARAPISEANLKALLKTLH